MPAGVLAPHPASALLGFITATTSTSTRTLLDGAGVYLLATATANGTWFERASINLGATTPAGVARFFVNNGGALSTATNNCLVKEQSQRATVGLATGPQVWTDKWLDFTLPNTYRLYVTVSAGVIAGGGWQIAVFGRDL